MKKIYKGILASALTLGMVACDSNYLEQPPIDLVSDAAIGESVEAARAALYGLCEAMYIGYGDTDEDYAIRYANGEAYIQTYYGDSPSPDFADTWLYGFQKETQAWIYMTRDTGDGDRYPWMYAYNLINQANVILSKIDEVPGDPADIKQIKASALTIRAHAYIRLMQVYGTRFEDSKNGEALCVVLRTEPGADQSPLVSYKKVMEQIYEDLDDAIKLYTESGKARAKGFEPNIDVAKGLYSRAALINHDWEKAQQMAKEARQKYPIMSPDEYLAGFGEANGEWLWYNDFNHVYNGWNSWGASFSCNGGYATNQDWTGGGGVISYRLYKQIYDKNNTDVRCLQFWTPDKANMYVDLGIKEEDFWKSSCVNTDRMTMWGVDPVITTSITLWNMYTTPEGYSDGLFYAYGASSFGEALGLTDEDAIDPEAQAYIYQFAKNSTRVQFGAQIKFWSDLENLGDAQHPFLRAAELLLNEAEAAIENGDEKTARDCLEELNSNRMDEYTCTLSGDALKEEVRLYRRIELWGEGDTWFSFKRWNIPAVRESWKAGDPTSNNFLPYYEGTYTPDYSNGWRYEIPKSEKDYNTIINNQLNN
ncbi:MAG: RagB/SusD family nutrient uptake outer membrane protein [Muribaculaceae bacterium]|nr:RagB/SusD family nutrient uptake outer membrane protein [Muribaculaceae bacterium]